MATRFIEWGKRWRETLRSELGEECQHCGSARDLHFDCRTPRNHNGRRRRSITERMVFYRREHARGNLQLLCAHCNAVKGTRRNFEPPKVRRLQERIRELEAQLATGYLSNN